MKFKSVHKQYHGQKIILPIIGLTQLGVDGVIDVPEKAVSQFITSPDWICLDDIEDDKEQNLTISEQDVIESLEKLNLADLVKVASASFEEDEFKKFKTNKKLMLVFLKKNIAKLSDKSE